jgi:hypothetical protein
MPSERQISRGHNELELQYIMCGITIKYIRSGTAIRGAAQQSHVILASKSSARMPLAG